MFVELGVRIFVEPPNSRGWFCVCMSSQYISFVATSGLTGKKERKGWLVDVNVRDKIKIAQSLEMISVLGCAVQSFFGKIGTPFLTHYCLQKVLVVSTNT